MKEISAGGVVFRRVGSELEIQLILDRYHRITLAKGKQEPGETLEQTALREVAEETGIIGKIHEHLQEVQYQYSLSEQVVVNKAVHYYLIEAIEGSLQAQLEEIHEVRWYTPEQAWQLQLQHGYDNNHAVVKRALQRLGVEVGDVDS